MTTSLDFLQNQSGKGKFALSKIRICCKWVILG
jgi:hypothetical protein